MKTLPLAACLTALSALALPAPQPANASTGLVRCEGANGEVIYTDKACAAFDAKPVPISGELLTRLASDRDRETLPDLVGGDATALPAPGRRSPADGCARTPGQLARDLHGALALGDLNRVAESYHWIGHTHAQAQPVLARLERLERRPVQDVEFFDVTIGAAAFGDARAPAFARSNGMAGLMQLAIGHGDAYEVVDFEVQRYAGCYFVRFRDGGYRA